MSACCASPRNVWSKTLQLGAIAGVDQGSVIVLYTVAPTLGSGNAGLEKLLTAGPRPNSADRCRAWYGPAYANSSCAQAGYLWSAVEADGDVLSFDSARVWMTTRWAESGRFAARSHLIWGRQDRHIPREGRGRIHAALEDAGTRFSWVEVNGHHLASDRPAVTTEPATGEEADGSE
jgi:pimeloyl-ACP methyl ester carboxylesterase